jgi:hypothetical protein
MFPALRNEIDTRFSAVEAHLKVAPPGSADMARTMRGLAFVQIYGPYEYAVRNLTDAAVSHITASGHRFRNLRPSLLALFLDAEIKSLRDVGEEKEWDRRLVLFERAFSNSPLSTVAVRPHDGSHFRHTQLQMLFRSLGINRAITLRKRHLFLIDEVVAKRNSIAHGDEAPKDVGSRFSKQEMLHKTKIMRGICLRLVSIVGEYCAAPQNHRR